jgi:predicted RNA-binding protein with RPS1 domain
MNPNPFQKFYDEQKHLDTDELRHKIKPVVHIIDQDFKGQEHLYCDKSQLDAEGKYRRPKKLQEAERRGFNSVMDMYMADKKAEEDKKVQETVDLRRQVADLTALVQQLLKK